MNNPRISAIKHAQKESFLRREISAYFLRIIQDKAELKSLIINRVKLTPDKGRCIVYFYSPDGKEDFNKKLKTLVLYKHSIRTALSKALQGRYTPELTFKYDDIYDQQSRVNDLIEKLKDEGKL